MTFGEVYDHDRPVAMYMLFREAYGSTSSLWHYSLRYNIDVATISDFEVFPNGIMIYFRDGSSKRYERLSPDNTEDSLLEMELSVRAYNCLTRGGCHTVDDVCEHTEKELLGFRRLGKGILAEIVDKLSERGRHLREETA